MTKKLNMHGGWLTDLNIILLDGWKSVSAILQEQWNAYSISIDNGLKNCLNNKWLGV